jgi:nitrite reductase/ring-hydroxylating ferredoxin subunit
VCNHSRLPTRDGRNPSDRDVSLSRPCDVPVLDATGTSERGIIANVTDDTCSSCVSRRMVLGGAAAAAAALTPLAAAAAAVPMPTQDLGPATSIPVGGGRLVQLNGKPVMLTQPKKGTFKAFSAVCPHQGCVVDKRVTRNRITCKCHDSVFDAATGRVLTGPARRALPGVKIKITRGRIVAITTAAAAAASTPTTAATPAATSESSASGLPAGFARLEGSLPADGQVVVLAAGGKPVLVHRVGSMLRTFSAQCPHAGATNRWNKTLVGGAIKCNNHGYSFDPQSGVGTEDSGFVLRAVTAVNTPDGWIVDTRNL